MTTRRRTSRPALRTPAQAHQWLRDNGISVAEFARSNGLSRDAVVDVLRGNCKGHRGASHRAAVALGIKPPPDSATDSRKSTRSPA